MTLPPPDLPNAILQTLAYSDIFDYPLTASEIHRYLIGIPTTLEAIRTSLANGLQSGNLIAQTG
ncbi:MAG TPA: hypothetical protein PK530_18370, partial [Anaerolineales bacterium]|nr:hypothetical protein [Anaerolineales bacterium]